MGRRLDDARSIAAGVADDLGLTVYDVEEHGGTLRVLLDRPGGIDVDALTEATRRISRALDELPGGAGAATLEVSSPGLERRLRTPEHFAGAVGERVVVKTRPHVEGERRFHGVLGSADGTTVTVRTDEGPERTLDLDDIEKATTEFVWQATPKPSGGGRGRADRPASAARPTRTSEATR